MNDVDINLDTGGGETARKMSLDAVPLYEVVSLIDTGDQTSLVAKRSYDYIIGETGAASVGTGNDCA